MCVLCEEVHVCCVRRDMCEEVHVLCEEGYV